MVKGMNKNIISGDAISPGIAIGKAFLYHDILTRDIASYSIAKRDIPFELKRLTNAFTAVKRGLYNLSRTVSHNISIEDGSIFKAQRMMIEDDEFNFSFEEELRNEMINAEQVVKNVFRKQIMFFQESSNETIKAKADDLRDIQRKIMHFLLGIDTSILEKLPLHAIIITRRLLPSDTVRLDQQNIEGIIVQEGSKHAHSALLARSLGIPALCTNGQEIQGIRNRDNVVIDGYASQAVIGPGKSIIKKYRAKKEASLLEKQKRAKVIRRNVKTKTGRTIKIMANASTKSEIQTALDSGCDGIGLLRTETIYLQSKVMPTEEELYQNLKAAIKPVRKLPILIRLLDIGGDKRLPYFKFEDEFGPFLGLRGVRLLLSNRDLLNTQLNVLVKLSRDFVFKVLIPMVTIPEEIVMVKNMLRECEDKAGSSKSGRPLELGSMIETPAAALAIREIAGTADFISIGTNDLIQYIMAASRENPNVASLYSNGVDYVLPLVRNIVKTCRALGKECSVCGEIINDEVYIKKFIEQDIDQFSVSPFRIPHLKSFIKGLTIKH